MRNLKANKLTIEVRMMKQTVDKNIIKKVCDELYRSTIKFTDLINFVTLNRN